MIRRGSDVVLYGPPPSLRVRKEAQAYLLYGASHVWHFLQVERKKEDDNLLYGGLWSWTRGI